ncbi:MAG: hypothetical protein LBG73_01215 [Spirochaetaceae bacterium]|jgi:hypothetical protein|nr:hypothetical protein [Spirochaetaceae bacterium]
MRLFCLLWIPAVYLFWSALLPERSGGARGIIALVLGSITGLLGFFLGAFVEPGGFGLSRWISGFVDVVAVPALLPFAAYLMLLPFKGAGDFGAFALLWLIPDMGIRLVSWSVQSNPLLLTLVPILRTAVALGISVCISLIKTKKALGIVSAVLGILILPLAGTTCYWAFFSQSAFWGALFLGITVLPGTAGISLFFYKKLKHLD